MLENASKCGGIFAVAVGQSILQVGTMIGTMMVHLAGIDANEGKPEEAGRCTSS